MTCTIVVGGQYGSEGKGKVVARLVQDSVGAPWSVRVGGPNSGHTVPIRGKDVVVLQCPGGVGRDDALLAIAAGSAIRPDILIDELKRHEVDPDRVFLDPRAVIINQTDRERESHQLTEQIGSTASGVGDAFVRRMERRSGRVLLVEDVGFGELAEVCCVEPVAPRLHETLKDIIVEGTQGFGLSLFHSQHYPFCTSRDTTASGFASEVGIPPRMVDEVVVCLRTFPIRVGGNSGPLKDEITWDEVAGLNAVEAPVQQELTSVTRRLRRVGKFDLDMVYAACRYNGATALAVMGMDRLNYNDRGVRDLSALSTFSCRFINHLEEMTQVPVKFIGTGPAFEDMIRI